MAKLNELSFELLPHPPYSPDLAPSDYWLFADLKKILQGKRFGSNEEVIAKTEVYFESKDESFYKKGIEKLEKLWNECTFCQKSSGNWSIKDKLFIIHANLLYRLHSRPLSK